ncbi:uncharacterized protein [Typha latifolia]|uniref:uncharacterized protein n=1 Tax=Typha latifolia TaxID=4733 RepID=UPI003C3066AE
MTETASSSSKGPRYAPPDPTLPKPWKGLIDGSTGYIYFWNPDTNATQYERPVVATATAESTPPLAKPEQGSFSNQHSEIRGSSLGSNSYRPNASQESSASAVSMQNLKATTLGDKPSDMGRDSSIEADGHQHEITVIERQKLVGTVNWGTATLFGVFTGLLYGGTKEAAASVSKDAEVMLKMGSTPDKREQYRLMRDAMEKRFNRITRGSLVGGVRLGMFTATFFGIQNLLSDKRGVHDVLNIAGAGSATAAMFGLILPGSMMWRARNILLGSVLGAGICFPLGWLQLKLVEKANQEIASSNPSSDLTERGEASHSRVGAAIEKLEGRLKK